MKAIISYKNFLLIKNKSQITKYRIADIDSINDINIKENDEVVFKINNQWLSEKNRFRLEKLTQNFKVENNTLYPIDDLEKHFIQVDEFISKKKVSMQMDENDIKTLNNLIEKYNKSTINKYTRKI